MNAHTSVHGVERMAARCGAGSGCEWVTIEARGGDGGGNDFTVFGPDIQAAFAEVCRDYLETYDKED